jgi:hypothetical protein
MTESEISTILRAIGNLEAKVDTFQENIADLFKSRNELCSRLDKLQQAHDDQLKAGGCTQINNVDNHPIEKSFARAILRPTVPVLISGVLVIVILVLLMNMGLRF